MTLILVIKTDKHLGEVFSYCGPTTEAQRALRQRQEAHYAELLLNEVKQRYGEFLPEARS